MVWRKGGEKKKNIIVQEVEGFETTLSCYVESYLNKFVPHKTSHDVIVFNKKYLRIKYKLHILSLGGLSFLFIKFPSF